MRKLFIGIFCILCVVANSQTIRTSRKVEFKYKKDELNFTKETKSFISLRPKTLYIVSEVLEPNEMFITLDKLESTNQKSGVTIKKFTGTIKDGRSTIVWVTYMDEKLIKVALQENDNFIIFGYMDPV